MTSSSPVLSSDLRSYGTILNEKAAIALHQRRHRRQYPAPTLDLSHWMSLLPDTLPVSSLTLPGTHDSAAYTMTGLPFVSTQTLDISTQLSQGIRYLDLRCGLVRNELRMVHGPAVLPRTLAEVLEVIYDFLAARPSEALVVQLKQDREPEASDPHFGVAVWAALLPNQHMWRLENSTPTLGELRGRVQLFRRFGSEEKRGINVTSWRDNLIVPFLIRSSVEVDLIVQDNYHPVDPLGFRECVESKWTHVSSLLTVAEQDPDPWRWYINFASAYEFNLFFQFTPHNIAVGAWWWGTFVGGLNPRLAERLKYTSGKKIRCGIVVMDYPESPEVDLVRLLVMTNFEDTKSSSKKKQKVNTRAVLAMVFVLLAIFIAGSLLVFIHGPVEKHWCSPFLHACSLPQGRAVEGQHGG